MFQLCRGQFHKFYCTISIRSGSYSHVGCTPWYLFLRLIQNREYDLFWDKFTYLFHSFKFIFGAQVNRPPTNSLSDDFQKKKKNKISPTGTLLGRGLSQLVRDESWPICFSGSWFCQHCNLHSLWPQIIVAVWPTSQLNKSHNCDSRLYRAIKSCWSILRGLGFPSEASLAATNTCFQWGFKIYDGPPIYHMNEPSAYDNNIRSRSRPYPTLETQSHTQPMLQYGPQVPHPSPSPPHHTWHAQACLFLQSGRAILGFLWLVWSSSNLFDLLRP